MKTKILFIGTADFGIPVLEALASNKDNEIRAITQPDRKGGRGKKIIFSPIKKIAMLKKIDIFQPENINEPNFVKTMKELEPDIILVVAYGQILSNDVLNIPKKGCINIHGSLLPLYRGAAPINWVIINGEDETGITYIYMNSRVDDGDIIAQYRINVHPDDTFGELSRRLSRLSAETVNPVINDFINGKLQRIPQDRNKATYTRKLNKTDGEVNWKNKSEKIYNFMRGTIPYPGAYTYYHGKKMKIIQAKRISELKEVGLTRNLPGSVVAIKKDGFFIATGDDGLIKIEKLIPAGAREMTAGQFVNGYKIKIGDRLIRENV